MKKTLYVIGPIFLMLFSYFAASLFATVISFFILMFTEGAFGNDIGIIICSSFFTCLFISIFLYLLDKRRTLNLIFLNVNVSYIVLVSVVFTLIFVITQASLLHPLMSVSIALVIPFFPTYVLVSLFSGSYSMMITVGITLIYSICFILVIKKKYKLLPLAGICMVCGICCLLTYFNSPNYKYQNKGHDFAYMGGYSSTDLSDYTPYSDSGKLAALDHEPEFIIEEKEDMPILDGAEACYPLYSSIAKTLYKDIDVIEKKFYDAYRDENGTIVTFYNTAVGFDRLITGEVDMFFGAKPSQSQLELAQEYNVELEYTAIGKEAFVFFVNEENPINALTSEQIRAIYHGDIKNWREVDGKNEKIIAFQRPERSGSQSMMLHFMGDTSLKEPLTFEMEHAMMGIVEQVAEYHNEAGAIGYSFRYFLEDLNEVEDVKILSVDGVYPSTESIKNEEYPVITTLYCITVKGNDNVNVQKVLDFLLSEDGQYLVEQSGYSPIN